PINHGAMNKLPSRLRATLAFILFLVRTLFPSFENDKILGPNCHPICCIAMLVIIDNNPFSIFICRFKYTFIQHTMVHDKLVLYITKGLIIALIPRGYFFFPIF